jgi:hypothetical protein
MMLFQLAASAAETNPAGGAEVAQVIGATAAAMVLTAALLVFGLGHRSGRIQFLGRIGDFSTRVSGLPGWAAVPAAVAGISLLGAAFGFYWDVSLHIDNGRDAGPLANPGHYFILLGLFGILSAGWLAMVMPREKPGPAAISLARDWQVPVSGVLLMACAAFALGGFPLDDFFHRLFGQDVTLWGPTHLMMLGGAAFSLVAIIGLLVEGRLAAPRVEKGLLASMLTGRVARAIRLLLAFSGLLTALSIFQAEFDWGVPQFRILYQPVLIALAAAIALVSARTVLGRGGALGAVAIYLVIRGSLTLVVGPVLGESVTHFPLYVAEALLVEAIALVVAPRSGLRFGAIAGLAIGTVGVLAEWGWSHVWMPIPIPDHLVLEAVLTTIPIAVAGGVLGSLLAAALQLRPDIAGGRTGALATGLSLVVIGATFAYLLPTKVPDAMAQVSLADVTRGGDRTVAATVRFRPADLAENADWVTATAWQGGDKLIVDKLRKVGGGVYRTTEPIPVTGSWKSVIRVHRGSEMSSIPIYLPEDKAIPAAGVPALAEFTRTMTGDHDLLQRERKDDVPGWLFAAAGALVLAFWLVLIAAFSWGLGRIARLGARPEPGPPAATAAPPPARRRELAGV